MEEATDEGVLIESDTYMEEDSDGELLESDSTFTPTTLQESQYDIQSSIQTISNNVKYVSTLAVNRLMDMNPADLISLNPLSFIAQTAIAVGLEHSQGSSKPADMKTVIEQANQHLEKGREAFSSDQSNIVLGWIEEAKRLLNTQPTKSAPVAETKSGITAAIPKSITFRSLICGNDTSGLDPQLVSVITALREFCNIPYQLVQTPREIVDERVRAKPAIGSSEFASNLQDRAHIIAKSVIQPNSKRVILAFGGPGTAKSTGCRLMAEWAGFPMAMLSGEAFRRMCSTTHKQSTFDVFMEWVAQQVLLFRQDGNRVMMGVILLDDFHLALENDGPFEMGASNSRQQFLQFVKNMGDSSQETIVSVELAPGRRIPLNMRHVHLVMTLNRAPDDLYQKADAAIRSRYVNLGVGYASEEDRRNMAKLVYIPQIKAAIAAQLKTQIECLIFDDKVTEDTVMEVVEADICIFRDKFRGLNGIRGLTDLMEMFRQHVLKNLPKVDRMPSNVFALVKFDAQAATQRIEDYKKDIDVKTAEVENSGAICKQIETLRQMVHKLPTAACKHMLTLLTNAAEEKYLKPDVAQQLEIYQQRLNLSNPTSIGDYFKRDFGYLMAGDGEVDRFEPMKRVAVNIYMRLAASRKLDYLENNPIYVKPTGASGGDLSIYSSLGQMLGGIPVVFIQHAGRLMKREIDSNTYKINDTYPLVSSIRGRDEFLIYAILPDTPKCVMTVSAYQHGSSTYMVLHKSKGPCLLLTPGACEKIHKKGGHGEQITFEPADFMEIGQEGCWKTNLKNKITPRLNFLGMMTEEFQSSPSADESIVVLMLSKMEPTIKTWHSTEVNHAQLSPVGLLMAEIKKQLNSPPEPQCGKCIDFRGVTVMFVDQSESICADPPNGTITWLMGAPPIQGRAIHARNFLMSQLKVLEKETKTYMNILDESDSSSEALNIKLQDVESEIFEELVKFDQEMAILAKKHDLLECVPISILERLIVPLLEFVRSRVMDIFGLGVKSPNLLSSKASWYESYAPLQAQIDKRQRLAEIAIKEQEERELLKQLLLQQAEAGSSKKPVHYVDVS